MRILLVAEEAGAAAFLAPLWRRWLERPPGAEWHVALGDAAARTAERAGMAGLSLLPPEAGTRLDRVLCSASGSALERAALSRALRDGARAALFIDLPVGYSRRTRGLAELAERILVPDDRAVEEARAEGLDPAKLVALGHPGWEAVALLPPAPREAVLFLSQPVATNYGTELGYDERSAWAMLLEARRLRPDLVLRLGYGLHPALEAPGADELAGAELLGPGSGFEGWGTVAGMFSAGLVEALLAGRDVVSVQPGLPAKDHCPFSRRGRIRRVGTAEELAGALDRPWGDARGLRESLAGSLERLERFLLE